MRTASNVGKPVPAQGAAVSENVIPLMGGEGRREGVRTDVLSNLSRPSSLYRANLWRYATAIARRTPHYLLCRLAGHVAKVYWLSCPNRRRVAFENLLPAVHGDVRAARIATRELFQQFAIKLADLWRYESGLSIYNLFHSLMGWEHFEAAQSRNKGVLLVTLHLGNWEFGAPL